MQMSEDELAKNYGSLEDEQLLALSAAPKQLTEAALRLLMVELRRRHLDPVSVSESVQTNHPDAQRIVTLRRFDALPEAMAARAALDAAGIACFLRDENAVRTMWHLSNFIGGMRLDVLEEDEHKASAMLLRRDATDAGIPLGEGAEEYVENAFVCPECGSWDVNRVTPLAGLAMIVGWIARQVNDQTWECNACHHVWVDNTLD